MTAPPTLPLANRPEWEIEPGDFLDDIDRYRAAGGNPRAAVAAGNRPAKVLATCFDSRF
jgi:hypothetical protein